tara:strand:- start:339 stop:851 length:513 start_codon:yes stop_codon:yes gene_type:complete
MKKANIFNKKKRFRKKNILLFVILIIIFSFIYFYLLSINNKYFEIASFKNPFFLIPDDKGGIKVLNIDKKSLHLNQDIKDKDIYIELNLKYSIQIFASDNFYIIKDKINNYVNKKLLIDDFYIISLNTNITSEYLLLYKNFESRELALTYCHNYMKYIDNCLIVNVENIN